MGRPLPVTASRAAFIRPRVRPSVLGTLLILFAVMAAPRVGIAQCVRGWVDGVGIPGVNGEVRALLVLPDGDLIVGGDFSLAGSLAASNIARYTPSSGAWSALGSGVGGTVYALAVLPNGHLVAGGSFLSAGGGAANRIARCDPASGEWTALGSGMNATVRALAVMPSGDLIAGGFFTTAGGVAANRVARFVPATAEWKAMGTGTTGSVYALAATLNGTVIVGGDFLGAGGLAVNRIARFQPATAAWSALGSGVTGTQVPRVYALATLPNNDVIAAGNFRTAGNVVARGVALYRRSDGVWSNLGAGLGSEPRAILALPNGDVIAGGTFRSDGGPSSGRIARYDRSAQIWSLFDLGTADAVHALAFLPSGDLALGGSFAEAGGSAAAGLAGYALNLSVPIIVRQPASTSACRDDVVEFRTAVGNFGPIAYQWQLETPPMGGGSWQDLADGPLPGAEGTIVEGASSPTLAVLVLNGLGSVRVRCVLTNACGTVLGAPAILTVISIDVDRDGDEGTDADIEAFFAAVGGSRCPACDSLDFDGDGESVTDADIEAFFRLLAGGSC